MHNYAIAVKPLFHNKEVWVTHKSHSSTLWAVLKYDQFMLQLYLATITYPRFVINRHRQLTETRNFSVILGDSFPVGKGEGFKVSTEV